MAPWDEYDLCLKAAMAYVRPKSIHKKTRDAISIIDEESLPEIDAAKLVTSNTNQENKCPPSKPTAVKPKTKSKPKQKNQTSTKQAFACVSCNMVFINWRYCA